MTNVSASSAHTETRACMTLAPLVAAGPLIAALVLGILQLAGAKGTRRHRALDWAWVSSWRSSPAAPSPSNTIRQFGPFPWMHGLSLFTLVMLGVGVADARAGRIAAHRWTMISLFVGALVITGLFTLLPGRVMHNVVFGG